MSSGNLDFRMVRTENGFTDLVIVAKEKEERGGGEVQLEQVQINQRSVGEEATPTPPPQRNEGAGIQGAQF